jgi:hypothetical protein
MSDNKFNWDKYFSKAQWNDIYHNSPVFEGQRLPSIINRDAELVYLSSQDLGFSILDKEGLASVLSSVKASFRKALESKSYYKAAIAESDFNTIKNLLLDLDVQTKESLES